MEASAVEERARRKNNVIPSWGRSLVAGGGAGMIEALACHPLDTIKVRMQLKASNHVLRRSSLIGTTLAITRREGLGGLYRGLGIVLTGIIPKMAIRFSSFETYKQMLADKQTGSVNTSGIFVAGLAAGITESALVVQLMEVVKIRLQAQSHSIRDKKSTTCMPKARSGVRVLFDIVQVEGFSKLYRGVSLTALRQGSNQAIGFSTYTYAKDIACRSQPQYQAKLPTWQTTLIGLLAGTMGPLSNQPIDTLKTKLQGTSHPQGSTAWKRVRVASGNIMAQEGLQGFYKGIVPRLIRVAPGQAITFTVYELLIRGIP